MSDLISRESLKHRINLNYNNHQYIDTQSIKDIINTEPSVEEKTVEELKKIKEEINNGYPTSVEDIIWIIDNKMSDLKEKQNERL